MTSSTIGQKLTYLVDAAYETAHREDGMRWHLGASIIGDKCMRAIWFAFRWCDSEALEGRMLRLFNRGHREEPQFVELLRGVGAEVWTEDGQGRQFRISHLGGHYGGSCDAVARRVPGLDPAVPVLCELKTHNTARFKQLKKEGVRLAKPEHYRQASCYAHGLGLAMCLYGAVNKNDDELHFEVFAADLPAAEQMLKRAEWIVFRKELPPRISETPAWHECRFCAMQGVCFKVKKPRFNCRTCRFSNPEPDGSWSCARSYNYIVNDKVLAKQGCAEHDYLPFLL